MPGTSCALPAHFSQFCILPILPIHASEVGSALISTVEFSPPKPHSLSLTAPRFCPLSSVCGVGSPAGGALLSHTHTEQYGSRRVSPLLGLSVSALDLDVLKISDTPACPRGPLAPGGQSFFTVSKSRPLWHDRRATQELYSAPVLQPLRPLYSAKFNPEPTAPLGWTPEDDTCFNSTSYHDLLGEITTVETLGPV